MGSLAGGTCVIMRRKAPMIDGMRFSRFLTTVYSHLMLGMVTTLTVSRSASNECPCPVYTASEEDPCPFRSSTRCANEVYHLVV